MADRTESQQGCDEYCDPYCEPCFEAMDCYRKEFVYCEDCYRFLCRDCFDFHEKFQETIHHSILEGAHMPKSLAEKPLKYEHCEIHIKNLKERFCNTHKVLVCSTCLASAHIQCNVASIGDICKTIPVSETNGLFESIEKLRARAKSMKTSIETNSAELEENKKTMLKKTRSLYKKMIMKVKTLFEESQTDIETEYQSIYSELNQRQKSINDIIVKLETVLSDGKRIKRKSVDANAFLKIQAHICEANQISDDLKDLSQSFSYKSLSFEPSELMASIPPSEVKFGYVLKELKPVSKEEFRKLVFPLSPRQPTPPTKAVLLPPLSPRIKIGESDAVSPRSVSSPRKAASHLNDPHVSSPRILNSEQIISKMIKVSSPLDPPSTPHTMSSRLNVPNVSSPLDPPSTPHTMSSRLNVPNVSSPRTMTSRQTSSVASSPRNVTSHLTETSNPRKLPSDMNVPSTFNPPKVSNYQGNQNISSPPKIKDQLNIPFKRPREPSPRLLVRRSTSASDAKPEQRPVSKEKCFTKTEGDRDCCVTGMDITSDNRLLVVDRWNKKVKMFSPNDIRVRKTYTATAQRPPNIPSVLIPNSPWDIAVLSDSEAVVSTDSQMFVLDISETQLTIKSSIHSRFNICGVSKYRDGVFAVTCPGTKPPSVTLMDTGGNVIWSSSPTGRPFTHAGGPFQLQPDEQVFADPRFISCYYDGKTPGHFVVTDKEKHTLTMLRTEDGTLVSRRRCRQNELQGIATDKDGNVYVCNYKSKEVSVFSKDLSKKRILLHKSDLGECTGITSPYAIVYDRWRHQLIISYVKCDYIEIFKLP